MNTQCTGMEPFIGGSKPIADLSRSLRKASEGDWTVLIHGESGTGKGLAARTIHRLSRRADRPFVVVNCGAIPESLVESELFGHERGAFTGADRQRKGKFEAAHTGTLLLDEIGELSLTSQTRLLNVLQDREIERLGGEGRRIPLDVRIIAATNCDLAAMVANGTFRQDLYFRLSVFSVRTPTLRERPEDVAPLAHHFASKAGALSISTTRSAHSSPIPGRATSASWTTSYSALLRWARQRKSCAQTFLQTLIPFLR